MAPEPTAATGKNDHRHFTTGLCLAKGNRRRLSPILSFIRELAEYEKLLHEVVASVETLEETLFGEVAYAQSVIGEYQGTAVVCPVLS